MNVFEICPGGIYFSTVNKQVSFSRFSIFRRNNNLEVISKVTVILSRLFSEYQQSYGLDKAFLSSRSII